MAAASAAHSRHLIWVVMAYGWAAGGCWLNRYELEDLASEVLSTRSPTVSEAHERFFHWQGRNTAERARRRRHGMRFVLLQSSRFEGVRAQREAVIRSTDRCTSCRARKTSAASARAMCLSRKPPPLHGRLCSPEQPASSPTAAASLRRPPGVAREYGIPAVVATGNATVRLHPGQLVTVDGSAGTITPYTEPITDQRDGQRVESDHAYVADGNVALAPPLPEVAVATQDQHQRSGGVGALIN